MVGAGTLTLSGANSQSGGVTLNAGTLNINNATALGATAGAFAINGGTIDNTSGSAVVNANNNPQTWGADVNFLGSNSLDLGTGAVTLTGSRTVTVGGNMLTVGGAIADGTNTFGLSKAGIGTLTLTGANTYKGGTTLNAGQLNVNNAAALGAGGGTFRVNGGAIDNTSGAPVTLANNNPETWAADINFLGTNNLNLGSGAVALTASRTVTVAGNALTVGGPIGDGGGSYRVTKAGAGR